VANVFSFHTGRPLALWERCSLQSFADRGHKITLYTYGLLDVPTGVTLADAAKIIAPQEKDAFLAIAPGKFSQFSDLFRFQLLRHHGGWWVDTDVVCLTDTLPNDEVWIAGTKGRLQTAVMRFPPGHALMEAAAREAHNRIPYVARGDCHTIMGPDVLTALWKTGRFEIPIVSGRADDCYLIKVGRIAEFGEPNLTEVLNVELSECLMVHWWSERFRAINMPRDVLPPSGSYLANLFQRHGGAMSGCMATSQWREHIAATALLKKRGQTRWELFGQRF
jgi:hypothetical protein